MILLAVGIVRLALGLLLLAAGAFVAMVLVANALGEPEGESRWGAETAFAVALALIMFMLLAGGVALL